MKTKVLAYFAGFALCALLVVPAIVSAQVGVDINSQLANVGSGIYGEGEQPATELPIIIGKIINVVLGFMGVILVVLVIFGGFKYMMSKGDPAEAKKGTAMIVNAVIGLAIVLAAYAIANFVVSRLVSATGVTTN
jgi:hypothetical protein